MLSRLKQLRRERGLSQRALADLLGISQQSVNKYENHNIEPDIELLCQIADVFDVSIDYLVGRSDDQNHQYVSLESDGSMPVISVGECRLVRDYRELSDAERQSIDLVISNYLANRPK